jgi:RNA polymerase sigma-70 factor (sigma-E family)
VSRRAGAVYPSFEDWMSARGPSLKRAAVLMCGDEHEAEDLVQETFVRVFVRWARVSRMDNPAGYAQRTLTNLYLSKWRSLQRDRSKRHLFVDTDTGDDSEAVADRAELATWLRSLGPKQRAAVVWRYYYDLPIPEIGRLLGCRESTVRAQLSRALANLRQHATALASTETPTARGEHRDAR